MDYETIVMELIVNGGNARSKALEAVTAAGKREFSLAKEKMEQCSASLQKAHDCQTELLQKEAAGESGMPLSLLMVHAQDHLMNAMTIRDMARQMIQMYRVIYREKADCCQEAE